MAHPRSKLQSDEPVHGWLQLMPVGLWLLSGVPGILAGVVLVASGRFNRLPVGIEALIAVGLGLLTMLAFAPFKHLRKTVNDRRELRRLTRCVRRLEIERGRELLGNLLSDRDDEIGELSRAIHEAISSAAAHRIEARLLRRTMDSSIKRETHRATDRLQRQAATDPLTGVGNRRALQERLQRCVESDAQPVSALVIDVDRFKEINDQLGHEAGDQCLAFLGGLLRSGLRGEDSAFRTGGDELIVLMPATSSFVAETVARRICALFGQLPWPHSRPARPTLSIGVAAALLSALDEPRDLIRFADEAMYAAKRSGRARVKNYSELRGAA